jgi:hypothetical protein
MAYDDCYEWEPTMLGSISTLPLPEDEDELDAIRKADKARQARGFGFTARMTTTQEPPSPADTGDLPEGGTE